MLLRPRAWIHRSWAQWLVGGREYCLDFQTPNYPNKGKDNFLLKALTDPDNPTVDWDELKKKVYPTVKSMPFGFEIRVMSGILGLQDQERQQESATDFMRYLAQGKEELDAVLKVKELPTKNGGDAIYCIHFCAVMSMDPNLGKKPFIINAIIDKLQSVMTLHPRSSRYGAFLIALQSVAKTSRNGFLHSLRIAEMVDLPINRRSQLLPMALEFGEVSAALSLWIPESEEGGGIDVNPWIKAFTQFPQGKDTIESFLRKVIDSCRPLNPIPEKDVTRLFSALGYKGYPVTIDDKLSKCSFCNKELPFLSRDELKTCFDFLRERVLKRDDIYLNTSPQELEKFTDFLKKVPRKNPYDVVIDGLNAAFVKQPYVLHRHNEVTQAGRTVSLVKNNHIMTDNLIKVMSASVKQFDRILFIGRNHMTKDKTMETFIKQHNRKIDTFFTENLSKDDPFMLLSALNHPNTFIMTNDFFRDHKFLMSDSDVSHMFSRWLNARLIRIPKSMDHFIRPPIYEIRVHSDDQLDTLHVPISSSPVYHKWICFQRK